MNYKNKVSKACEFPPKVRKEIMRRDMSRCCYCHTKHNLTIAHAFVPRSKGGLGVKENGVVLCMLCHHKLDNGLDKEHQPIKQHIEDYMRRLYDVSIREITYNKYSNFKYSR